MEPAGIALSFASMPPPDARAIVIADDSADDLFFAQRALRKAGVAAPLLTCADGTEVIALLKLRLQEKQPVPRAVFLDVKMPQLDGFQTLKWIRAQKQLDGVGVFMLSGSREARDASRVLASRRVMRWWCLLLLVTGCSVELDDVPGRACDDEHPCRAPRACVQGACWAPDEPSEGPCPVE